MKRSLDGWVLCLRGWLTIPRPAARATLVRTAWTRLEAPCPLDCRRPETSRCSSQGRRCCTFGEMWTRRWLASIPGGGSRIPGRATAPQRPVAPSCPLRALATRSACLPVAWIQRLRGPGRKWSVQLIFTLKDAILGTKERCDRWELWGKETGVQAGRHNNNRAIEQRCHGR